MTAGELLERLHGVRKTGPGRWLARCTGHEDKRPSLSIRELDDGRILMHCFAGCSVGEVARGAGIELQDLFPDREQPDQGKSERRPFPAADVLRALSDEAMLVATAAANISNGVELSAGDRARIGLAAERIHAGRNLALGGR